MFVTLDQRETIYKVGDPDENIPYATVLELSPCLVAVPAGAAITGKGIAKFSVHDNPAGHDFVFKATFQILKPDGTVAFDVTRASVKPLGGGESAQAEVALLLDGSKTTTIGVWQTRVTIEATDNDVVGAKPIVIRYAFCEFRVVEAGSSSSSSSSSSYVASSSSSSSSSSSYVPSSSSSSSSSSSHVASSSSSTSSSSSSSG